MGRKKIDEDKKLITVSLRVTPTTLDKINEVAAYKLLSFSKVVNLCLERHITLDEMHNEINK